MSPRPDELPGQSPRGSDISNFSDDDDSIIMDDENNNFTKAVENMKGGPYSPKVEEYIKLNYLNAPNKNTHLTDLAATKTSFTINRNFKDFEYKKENLLEIL